jgi:hypothetical protein
VVFDHVIAGRPPRPAGGGCARSHWAPMRDMAYKRSGVTHVPAPQQPRRRVTILVPSAKEPRALLDVEQVVQTLQPRF